MNTRHLIKNVNENSGGWSVMIKTVIVTIDRKLPNHLDLWRSYILVSQDLSFYFCGTTTN